MIALMVILCIYSICSTIVAFAGLAEVKALRESRPNPAAIPKPLCMCKHGYNYHDHNGCRAQVGKTVDGLAYKSAQKCSCIKYTGPEPLPEYYHPAELI